MTRRVLVSASLAVALILGVSAGAYAYDQQAYRYADSAIVPATVTVSAVEPAVSAAPDRASESRDVYDSPQNPVATNTAQSGVRWLDDIRPDRLQHIQDRHLRGGTLWDESTSYFNNADEREALVTDAADWTPIIQSNGNLATVVDAGRPIGWDAATGAQTDLYTVIIKPGEGVWTAHPGLPRVGS